MPTKGVVIGRGEQGLPIFYQFSEKCRFEVSFADRGFLEGHAPHNPDNKVMCTVLARYFG